MKTAVLIVSSIACINSYMYSATITLRFRPYPETTSIHSLKKAGTLAKQQLEKLSHKSLIAGIFTTYAGYLEASDSHGTVIFTRKHAQPLVHCLVTPRISPIVMFEQTIQNWEVIPTVPAQMYTIEQITDEATHLTYLNVQEKKIPVDNVIPLETLIIIAHPQHIIIPTGITITQIGQNLVMPTFYVKKGIHTVNNSLYMLNIAHLFGQVHIDHEKKETYYALQPTD